MKNSDSGYLKEYDKFDELKGRAYSRVATIQKVFTQSLEREKEDRIYHAHTLINVS